MIWFDWVVHFRGRDLDCVGTYRTLRMAFGRVYLSFGWRVSE
jgi:hypothetical protein